MGAPRRRHATSLIDQLEKEGHTFSFEQTVRLLLLAALEANEGGEAVGLGDATVPQQEVARFRMDRSLRYPAGEVTRVRRAPAAHAPLDAAGFAEPGGFGLSADAFGGGAGDSAPSTPESSTAQAQPDQGAANQRPWEVTITFLRLIGATGVMPLHDAVTVLQQEREKNHSVGTFLDLFAHRLAGLYYRAMQRGSLPRRFEENTIRQRVSLANGHSGGATRLAQRGRPDPITLAMYGLVGMAPDSLRNRSAIDDHAWLYFGGHFSGRRRSASALESMVGRLAGTRARITPFRGTWNAINPNDQSRLPSSAQPMGQNNCLGSSAVLGDRVWDPNAGFAVRMGPMTFDRYQALLPSGSLLPAVRDVIRLHAGTQRRFSIELFLEKQDFPPCRLGGDPASATSPRLGWTTLLSSGPASIDTAEDEKTPEAVAAGAEGGAVLGASFPDSASV